MQNMNLTLNTDLQDKLKNLTIKQLQDACYKGYRLYDYKRTFTTTSENMLVLRALALPLSFGLIEKNSIQQVNWQKIIEACHKNELTPQGALYKGLSTFVGNSNNQSLKNCVLLALLNPTMTAKAIYAEEKNQEPKSYVQEAKDILEKILREQKAQSTETEKSESSKPKFEFKPFGSKS